MFKLLEITHRKCPEALSRGPFLMDFFSVIQNIVLSFWKLLAYACQIEALSLFNIDLAFVTALPLDAVRR